VTEFQNVPLPLYGESSLDVEGLDVRILTVRQPWATALLRAKDVENRTWTTSYRGWVLVHSSRTLDSSAPAGNGLGDAQTVAELPRGQVLGAIRIVDVVRDSGSDWAEPGLWHWCHDPRTAVELATPIPWVGSRGLTRAPVALLRQLSYEVIRLIR
jgi:hypothetical protein